MMPDTDIYIHCNKVTGAVNEGGWLVASNTYTSLRQLHIAM
jgi:hypothetical protein